MSDFKIITQAELLTKSRELRDRVEISLHKLGPGAKSFQQSLNSIVAGLSVQNAHPVDDKQPSLFESPRVGQPRRKAAPKRKLTLDEQWKKHKDIKAERTTAGRTNTLKPNTQEKSIQCSKCLSYEPRSSMTRSAGRRLLCKRCYTKSLLTPGAPKKQPTVKKEVKKKVAKRKLPEFMAPMQASPELQAIVGVKPMPRIDVTKKIWDYIKKNKLQDAKNKRNINVDEPLGKVFADRKGNVPKQVSMFEMTKLVSRHLKPVKA